MCNFLNFDLSQIQSFIFPMVWNVMVIQCDRCSEKEVKHKPLGYVSDHTSLREICRQQDLNLQSLQRTSSRSLFSSSFHLALIEREEKKRKKICVEK